MNLFEQMKTLQKQAIKEGGYTTETQAQYDKMDAEYVKFDELITAEQRNLDRESREVAEIKEIKDPEKVDIKLAYRDAFSKLIRVPARVSPSDVLSAKEMAIIRAQSTTTTAGGYLIAEEFMRIIEEALLAYGGMREVSTVFKTDTGADMPMPTDNDTANKGAILAENTQDSENDLVFGTVTFKAYKYTSKIIRASAELLQDNAFDLNTFIFRKLGTRIARILNDHFTTGTGSSQPEGVVTGSTASGVTATVSGLTRANILALIMSVDPEYAKNGKLMFNNSTLQVIRALSFGTTDARPLYQESAIAGAPALIEGKPFVINQSMADVGASAKSMLFGDFSKYYIRDVMGTELVFFDEKYMDYYQKGFAAFARHDGRIVDAGTHPIKSLVHAAT